MSGFAGGAGGAAPREDHGPEGGVHMRGTWIAAMLTAVLIGATAAGGPAAGRPTVGLAISTLNNPFFVDLRDGAQAAAAKAGVTLVVLDAQNDPARQASSIEDLIAKKVRVVIINPTDSDAIVPT